MAQPRIFVSYSRKDSAFTQRLVEDLHRAGAEVWVDVDGIHHGNFMRAIDQALAKCQWMMLVLTPSAIASEYVAEETYTALHRVKQGFMLGVIPILAAPCEPGTIPPQWDVLQRYDAVRDYASALVGMLGAIGLSSSEIADVLVARGKKLKAQKEYGDTIPFFECATQLAPRNEDAWFNLGFARSKLEHYREALAAFDRVLSLDPDDAEAWANKAISLQALGRESDAQEAARRAKELGR